MLGKKPSMFEKLWGVMRGVVLSCFAVSCARSRAVNSPISVTIRAAIFNGVGMVIICVLGITIFEVIRSPARTLPQARRLIGLITAGSFSLIGEIALNRG